LCVCVSVLAVEERVNSVCVVSEHYSSNSVSDKTCRLLTTGLHAVCAVCAVCAVQVRLLVPGHRTVLGDAAAEAELFVTEEYVTVRGVRGVRGAV
jgi:hypothetical protein